MTHNKKEDWMNNKWRPAMGWMYMAVCLADFMIFPVLWSILQSVSDGAVNNQWQPITLQGAGLFHLAMGAVLGIAAYGRTQEKLGGVNNGGLPVTGTSTYAASASAAGGNFGYTPSAGRMETQPAARGFGVTDNSTAATAWQSSQAFASVDPSQAPPVVTGFSRKAAPPPMEFLER